MEDFLDQEDLKRQRFGVAFSLIHPDPDLRSELR
jgi:hypothetical protein